MKRDFIISSLHNIPEGVLEDECDLPRIFGDVLRPEDADQVAERLLAPHRIGGTYHFDRTQKAFRELVARSQLGPAQLALVIDRALALLPRSACATVAIQVALSLREDHFAKIGRGGLLSMRDAACLADAEECDAALRRIDEEIERRSYSNEAVGGALLVADGVSERAVEAAEMRLSEMMSRPRLADALGGMLVVLVPRSEKSTPRSVLLAHLALQAQRQLDPTLAQAMNAKPPYEVSWLDEARVIAEALPERVWARRMTAAKDFVQTLAARTRLTPAWVGLRVRP
jgi:hypothetical protein